LDISDLISKAKSDTTSDSHFDSFLLTNGWEEDDIAFRVINRDIFLVYSYFYYNEFKVLPHVKIFAAHSKYFKKYKIRMRKKDDSGKLEWGLKCSETFYDFIRKFKRDNDEWQKRFKNIQNGKRSHKARRVNAQEDHQLEALLATLRSNKGSTQK
jgi:hypothetical protein